MRTIRPFVMAMVCRVGFLLLVLPVAGRADPIDDYVEARMKQDNIPGLSLAVVRDGKIVKAKGYGFADLEHRVRATPDTVYRLASVSKQFTATAVMRLVEEGKIGLDEWITQYLDGEPEAWKPVTVRHLLTHTSGLPDVSALPGFSFRKDYTPEEAIRELGRLPVEFKPGERFSYNNAGYLLLGLIIAGASGKSFDVFLQERLFQPLNMTSTSVRRVQEIVPNRAEGYEWENGTLLKSEYLRPRLTAPSGGVLSTVRDLAEWAGALQAQTPLRSDSLAQMTTAATLNDGSRTTYGFGWSLADQRGHRLMEHGGATFGFSTHVARYTDDQLTVIVLCNRSGIDASSLAHTLAGILRPELRPASLLKEAKEDNDPQTTQALRLFMSAVAEEKESSLMTPALRRQLSADDRKGERERLKELKTFVFLAQDDIRGRTLERFGLPIARLRHYRMTTGKKTVYYTFRLMPDGRVIDYDAQEETP